MENHHAFNGKIHFKWSFSIAFCRFTRVFPLKNGDFPITRGYLKQTIRPSPASCRAGDLTHGRAAAVNLNTTPVEVVAHIQDVVRILHLGRRQNI